MIGETDGAEEAWRRFLEESDGHMLKLATAAYKRPELRQLYPFASLNNLRFSRQGADPLSRDLPYVLTTPLGEYEARAGNNAPLGTGDLDAVLDLVVQALR